MFRQLIAGAWLAIATIIAGCQAQPVKDTSAEQNAQGLYKLTVSSLRLTANPTVLPVPITGMALTSPLPTLTAFEKSSTI